MVTTVLPIEKHRTTSTPCCVERHVAIPTLGNVVCDWNRLAAEVPFRHSDWLLPWWRSYQRSGDELSVLVVHDEHNGVMAVAPWYVHESAIFGRVLRFLGSGKVSSDYATILCVEDRVHDAAVLLADWLMGEGRGTWDAIELSGVDQEDMAVAALAEALRGRGCGVQSSAPVSCWRVALPDTWEAYVATLSKSRRERVRQIGRRQFATGRARTHFVQSPEELSIAMGHLRELHERRRASLGGRGVFSSPRFDAFLDEVASRFLALGRLRLQWTELEGRPVAAEFDLLGRKTVYYYQSGIDPAAVAERPGWLSTIGALQWAIEHGYETYDFLRGDYNFKSHWRGQPRLLREFRIVPPEALPRLRHQAWRGAQWTKSWLKKGLRRTAWRRSAPTG